MEPFAARPLFELGGYYGGLEGMLTMLGISMGAGVKFKEGKDPDQYFSAFFRLKCGEAKTKCIELGLLNSATHLAEILAELNNDCKRERINALSNAIFATIGRELNTIKFFRLPSDRAHLFESSDL